MELADSVDESADDMTAAETAPSPMNEMAGGVKYWRTNGMIRGPSSGNKVPFAVSFL